MQNAQKVVKASSIRLAVKTGVRAGLITETQFPKLDAGGKEAH
jgi:hypothetical protein